MIIIYFFVDNFNKNCSGILGNLVFQGEETLSGEQLMTVNDTTHIFTKKFKYECFLMPIK